jgi:YgiT-type zinc finger domain-containing protein
MKLIACDICGQGNAKIRRVTRSYGRGKAEFLVRGVPAVSCPDCGEQYLTAATLRSLDHIKRHRRQLVVNQPVAVAQFDAVSS